MAIDLLKLESQVRENAVKDFRRITLKVLINKLSERLYGPINEEVLHVDSKVREIALRALRANLDQYYGPSPSALACQQLINELSSE